MAVSKSETIFLGHTPSDQRKFLVKLFEHLRTTHDRLIIPAVGEFTMPRCAIEAGWKPEQIWASDVSLFSDMLGYLFSGQLHSTIEYTMSDALEERWSTLTKAHKPTDILRTAFVLWGMKYVQLSKIAYQRAQAYDLDVHMEQHVLKLQAQIERVMPIYGGIHYEHRDLRELLAVDYAPTDVVGINPPAYTNGYTKMFDFTGDIDFDPNVPEFVWSKEYHPSYFASKESPAPFLWYRYQNTKGLPSTDVVFAKEYNTVRQDYWLFTKPEILGGFEFKGAIVPMSRKRLAPYRAPTFGPDDEIRPDSEIRFVQVPKEVALYYRDLWAHKLGNTAAEQYILMLVDGKVFSTLGIMLGDVYRLRSDKVFENYGFTAPSTRYPRANRLLMWCITSAEFGRFVRATSSTINRYWEMDGLKTACLSKYRHVKLNTGILPVTKREKMDNGLYKIMYETTFRDDTYADCVQRFLAEEAARDAKNEVAVSG